VEGLGHGLTARRPKPLSFLNPIQPLAANNGHKRSINALDELLEAVLIKDRFLKNHRGAV
jgi:hypothetical protein